MTWKDRAALLAALAIVVAVSILAKDRIERAERVIVEQQASLAAHEAQFKATTAKLEALDAELVTTANRWGDLSLKMYAQGQSLAALRAQTPWQAQRDVAHQMGLYVAAQQAKP